MKGHPDPNEGFRVLEEFDCKAIPDSSFNGKVTEQALSEFTPRKRAVFKLRSGCLALTEAELAKVVPEFRDEAQIVRPRSLRQVARLFGVSKERIRQIEASILARLRLRSR